MDQTIYTIGHSTHPIDKFLSLLKQHNISAIADVRSYPFSKINPQFNRESIQKSLSDEGIRYVFVGKELGARSDDPKCYVNGKVQYRRLEKTELFISGIDRLLEGMRKFRIAIMCAEKEPLDCHRTILVGRNLSDRGVSVVHILPSGELESHAHTMERLKSGLGIVNSDMFMGFDDSDKIAYDKQEEKIAYDFSNVSSR